MEPTLEELEEMLDKIKDVHIEIGEYDHLDSVGLHLRRATDTLEKIISISADGYLKDKE